MASLDDFFAKKDKKKKGKGKKFVTSETIAKTIEAHQSAQPLAEQEKTTIDIPTAPTQEDEWKEEEEQIQDLEGLKVKHLGLDTDQESEKQPQEQVEEEDSTGEGDKVPKDGSSPWQAVPTQQPEPATVSQPVPEKPSGVYVPPSRRGQGPVRSKAPPDLKNDEAFPSLKTSIQKEREEKLPRSTERGGAEFKEVQGSRSTRSDLAYRPPGLELTNKYSVLEDN